MLDGGWFVYLGHKMSFTDLKLCVTSKKFKKSSCQFLPVPQQWDWQPGGGVPDRVCKVSWTHPQIPSQPNEILFQQRSGKKKTTGGRNAETKKIDVGRNS